MLFPKVVSSGGFTEEEGVSSKVLRHGLYKLIQNIAFSI